MKPTLLHLTGCCRLLHVREASATQCLSSRRRSAGLHLVQCHAAQQLWVLSQPLHKLRVACVRAGLSANLGLAGLGTDTGNSVRGPSGHCSVVGLRPSLGLVSR